MWVESSTVRSPASSDRSVRNRIRSSGSRPTVGLDPEERIRFRTLLSELAGDRTVLLSTHIVEDIAQTCRKLAVLDHGRVRYHGTTVGLIDAARGRVWRVTTEGKRPEGDLTVVSMLQVGAGVEYRVVGTPTDTSAATETEPSLEDGYVWLMRGDGATEAAA
jgi:ABC-2 type transport system ATP-binding protein